MTPTTPEVILAVLFGIPLALGLLGLLGLALVSSYEDYRRDYRRSRLHPERYNGWDWRP